MAVTVNGGAPTAPQIAEFQSVFQVAAASHTQAISTVTGLQAALDAKQATLVSATNIKTVNGTTLLGSGDLAISGSVSDGDKGDVTVSASGATWTIDAGVVTLAKQANLAQDQFIGRVTASTGVPETATITAAARTVLDDTTVGNMVNTLGGATSTGTGGLVRATSPTLVTPALGTPSALVLTNATGLPATAVADGSVSNTEFQYLSTVTSNIQTQIDAKLDAAIATDITATKGTPIGADQIIILDSAAGDVPKLATLSSLPSSGGAPSDGDKGDITVSSTGTVWTIDTAVISTAARTVLDDTTVGNMVNTLGGATSTGTGGLARATSPTFVTPLLGTPTSGVLTNCTGLPVAGGGTGRATGTTAYALVATGTTATGAQQSLAAGATTAILVGGGASALPVWTTATGSGAPVRATSPTLVTPALGTPSSGTLTNCTGLPTAGMLDASVTLAKMANLAQDQFIVRTTASTGVPQTATVTAAARTVLDDATVGDMRTTLSAAARAQTGMMPIFIRTVANETLRLIINTPVAITITNITTRSASGTCTVTGQIDGTPLGGTANSASSTESSQAHASANVMSVGNDFLLAFSSNSACLGLAVNVHYTYTQA